MNRRSSAGPPVKSKSILQYFKPQTKGETCSPVVKRDVNRNSLITHVSDAVVDVSSGEEDCDPDAVRILTEIKKNETVIESPSKTIVRKCASRSSAPAAINRKKDSIGSGTGWTDDIIPAGSAATCSSIQSCGDLQNICPSDEDMDVDLSEFLDVLLDEMETNEQQDKLMHAVSHPISHSDPSVSDVDSFTDYKWNNLRSIIDFVLNDASYSHLLNRDDWQIIENITSLSVSSQRLFTRLYLRKHKWIRCSQINYPDLAQDVHQLNTLLQELVDKKLLIRCSTIPSLEEALNIMELKELKTCAASLGIRRTGNSAAAGSGSSSYSGNPSVTKSSLIESIMKHANSNHSIKSHFTGRKVSVADVALNQVKKILADTGYFVAEEACRLVSRLTFLYYPPQVNEDENGVSVSHEFFNQLKVLQGDMKYPDYVIRKKEIIFRERNDLVMYESACRLETLVLEAIAKKDHKTIADKYYDEAAKAFDLIFKSGTYKDDQLLSRFLRNQTAGHVYTRCLSHMVQSFEQNKQHEQAVRILNDLIGQDTYCQSYKGKWFERLVIDLEKHLKRPDRAFDEILRAMSDESVKLYFKYNLYVKGKKAAKMNSRSKRKFPSLQEFELEKCTEKTIQSATLRKPIQGRRTIFVAERPAGQSSCLPVENVALNHYTSEEGFSRGLHSESLVYHCLYNLLLWKQIYEPLDDAFRTFHQTLPLDFVHESFYTRRKDLLDSRFDQLRKMNDTQIAVEIEAIWNENFGTQCLFDWNQLCLQDVKDLAFCLGVDVLVAIFQRLCSNFRLNRSGFPDLILWNVEEKRVKAVEVKGPGDSLSGKQILWLDYFRSCGLPAEVCYVKACRDMPDR